MSEEISSDIWTPESVIPKSFKRYIGQLQSESSSSKNNNHLLIFLHILQHLKTTKRTGWVNFEIDEPESIADHMYRMAVICMLTGNESLNSSRCVKIALVHDMAEALVGDITPVDSMTKEEKHRRELETIKYMTELLKPFNSKAAQEIYELWNEYENISSPEARFVKDVDKFELLVQTLEYEKQHNKTKDLTEFTRVREQIKTPEVSGWADSVLKQRDDFWEGTAKPQTQRTKASPTPSINSE